MDFFLDAFFFQLAKSLVEFGDEFLIPFFDGETGRQFGEAVPGDRDVRDVPRPQHEGSDPQIAGEGVDFTGGQLVHPGFVGRGGNDEHAFPRFHEFPGKPARGDADAFAFQGMEAAEAPVFLADEKRELVGERGDREVVNFFSFVRDGHGDERVDLAA